MVIQQLMFIKKMVWNVNEIQIEILLVKEGIHSGLSLGILLVKCFSDTSGMFS